MATEAKASPLRLLVLTPTYDTKDTLPPFPAFLENLTGAAPSPDISSFAGYTSHPALQLKTRYYEVEVTIWCDELPLASFARSTSRSTTNTAGDEFGDEFKATPAPPTHTTAEPQASLSEWQEQMLSTTAREVRDVIGGIVIVLPLTQKTLSSTTSSQTSQQITNWIPYLEAVTAVRDAIEEESGRDVGSIVLLQGATPSSTTAANVAPESLREQMEEECLSTHGIIGWDYVSWIPSTPEPLDNQSVDTTTTSSSTETRNEFGEKTGFPRVLEVLHSIDWTVGPATLDSSSEPEDLIGPNEQISLLVSDHSDPLSYANINKATSAGINPMTPTRTLNAGNNDDLATRDQTEFQREMLGLKMAMADTGREDSTPSSLAGEYDVDDFGARTPMPMGRPGLVRGVSGAGSGSGTGSGTGRVGGSGLAREMWRADDGDDGEGVEGTGEGGNMQVEQLTGLMERIVATREAAEGMAGAEREKFARREVNKIMKELG